MKQAGTIKVEIVPDGDGARVYARLRAMRGSLPLALNFAFRDVFPEAMAQLESALNGERGDAKWQGSVRKRLRHHWNAQLQSRLAFASRTKGQGKKSSAKPPDPTVFEPTLDTLCSETSDHIVSRFSGEHFRDLMAGRAGVPTFKGGGKSFFAEGRAVSLSGTLSTLRMRFPLWGSGKKATPFKVFTEGNAARATMRQLLLSSGDRENVIELERRVRRKESREQAEFELEQLGAIKMGRVGISYDENRQKWFALISWTRHAPEGYKEGQAAALHLGCQVFLQAATEKGELWQRPGFDILAARARFHGARWRLSKCKRSFGKGSRGHGKKRRELPFTKLSERESQWVKNWIRTMASDLIKWCLLHGVSDLYLEDLSGIRDTFEKETEGDAPEPLKRMIHQWPYYETQQAIERQAAEFGVRCHKTAQAISTHRCPSCGHTDPENVTFTNMLSHDEVRVLNGMLFKRVDKRAWFSCTACKHRGSADVVSCMNHLALVGRDHSFGAMQEASKKRKGIQRKKVASAANGIGVGSDAAE